MSQELLSDNGLNRKRKRDKERGNWIEAVGGSALYRRS